MIYGEQNVKVRLYGSLLSVDSTTDPTRKVWRVSYGLRNLLAWPVGDEQLGPLPADTIGVSLAIVSGPTISRPSPCTGCTAVLTNRSGTGSFTAAGQPFFFWPERIPAYGAVGGDTTLSRRTVVFTTSRAVTSFRFTALVSAPWAAPAESSWTVSYTPDSLPANGKPKWRQLSAYRYATTTVSGGALSIDADPSTSTVYYRSDSVAPATNAYLEVRVAVPSAPGSPAVAFSLVDGTRFIAIGLSNSKAGFVELTTSFPYALAFLPRMSWFVDGKSTQGTHSYRLQKFAADSAVLLDDGVRLGSIPYASLPANTIGTAAGTASFGALSSSTTSSRSLWYFVAYGIGTTTP